MQNKMEFSFGCHGAGTTKEIIAPEIVNKCPKCSHTLKLIRGGGLLNSGYNSFYAECSNCGHVENIKDYDLWKKCLKIGGINIK